MKLNKEQGEAVGHGNGPLLIIAGAGTGKTTVITERIVKLISSGKAGTSEILALTFTEKAANEMQDRIDRVLPMGYTDLWVSTFHSFCDRVLRDHALHIGLDPKFKLMTGATAIKFVRDRLFEFDLKYFLPLGNPDKFVGGMLVHFSRMQDEDVAPMDYIKWVNSKYSNRSGGRQIPNSKLSEEEKLEKQKYIELSGAYRKYEELKIKEGRMDFGDLIVKVLKLFRERANVLQEYRKQFKYILVDEFQDTNIAQYELLKLLAPVSGKSNLTVVGDDSQSVYKFRGAAVSNILNFKNSYSKAKIIVLIKNYRSTQKILDSAYKLIQHNNPDTLESKLGISKDLKSVAGSGESVVFIHSDRSENEADIVAKEVMKLANKGYEYGEMAILVRANNHSEPFQRALVRHGIPHQFLGPGKLFGQLEVIELISYLKVLCDSDDSAAFYRVLCMDCFDIDGKDLIKLTSWVRRKNLSLFETVSDLGEVGVSKDTEKKLIKLTKLIDKHFGLVKKETAGQILYYFMEETGMVSDFLNVDDEEQEKRIGNISKFFDKLKSFEAENADASVVATVDWLDLASELGESPLAVNTDLSGQDMVNILTVHSSKGLEFDVVFLVNLVSQRFPTMNRREQIPIPEELIKETLPEGDYHVQEERRLFYVGMTRARKKLILTASDYYGEAKRIKRLSPFIAESLGSKTTDVEKNKGKGKNSFLTFDKAKKQERKRRRLKVDRLSYSQISAFEICPLHYKLRYILNIPTSTSAALSMGTSVHGAMKNFYMDVKTGKRPTRGLLSRKLKEVWVNGGFKNKKHEERSFDKTEKMLHGYLKQEFSAKKVPVLVEQKFSVFVSGLKITGVIDRVDRIRGGIEIIDYKTGAKVPSQREVDGDLQLTIYALAATKIKEKPFARKASEVKLSLYYFEEQKKITTVRTAKQLREAERELLEYQVKIEESDFICSRHFLCQHCEYSAFCHAESD